jgi:hypothetical protein
MSEMSRLERRYRRLLAWYPARHRRTYGEEMIGVLLASAPDGHQHPRLAESFDLVRGGLQTRLRSVRTGLLDIGWRDALTICSVALPSWSCATREHSRLAGATARNPDSAAGELDRRLRVRRCWRGDHRQLLGPAGMGRSSGLDRDRGNHSDWNSPHDPGTSRAGADLAPGRPGLPMDGVGHRGGKRPE